MQIPETPMRAADLDLMLLLNSYGDGSKTYLPDGQGLGVGMRKYCKELYSSLNKLEATVAPLLDKVTSREMDLFTSHDHGHALKVAHIAWYLISEERRCTLTPPEIGLLVSAAFIHDLGMFLTPEERKARLQPGSDLWDRLLLDSGVRERIEELTVMAAKEKELGKQQWYISKLHQAHEALLCVDNRERHATYSRYQEVFSEMRACYQKDRVNMVDIDSVLSFGGDSYGDKLIEICVSHNESADALIMRDPANFDRPRFPRDYPVGSTTADLHFVAALLRISDILDFDRERTPPVLFHYFLPGNLNQEIDRSKLEWSKHMAISSWFIEPDRIVFRGRCRNHIAHHAVVLFCKLIADEILVTAQTFSGGEFDRLFRIPRIVEDDIHPDGYIYFPYGFELDDDRIYKLLMGASIYEDKLHAIRELIQNAVDACRLRDAFTLMGDAGVVPSRENRILIEYREPTAGCPFYAIEIRDTGIGMDEWSIKNWFLKVGRSFYSSNEFNKLRLDFRKFGVDFAPSSEFGIGFLAAFLLADKVQIETAIWEPLRGDSRRRIMEIHGPTRLIRLSDYENSGAARFRGTRVTLILSRDSKVGPPGWSVISSYLKKLCLKLPYSIKVQRVKESVEDEFIIEPITDKVYLDASYEESCVRIPVDDSDAGLKGEIVLLHPRRARAQDEKVAKESIARIIADDSLSNRSWRDNGASSLIRAGFRVGPVPGLPRTYMTDLGVRALISLDWENRKERRLPLTNLSRTAMADDRAISNAIVRIWLSWLIDHVDELPDGFLYGFNFSRFSDGLSDIGWMEKYSAYSIYKLASNGWCGYLKGAKSGPIEVADWEVSRGKALPRVGINEECYGTLQDMILPKVCKLQMGRQGRYFLMPPVEGWVEILKGCHDYVSDEVGWGQFVQYIGDIDDLLFYEYPGSYFLNDKFRLRVEGEFSGEEIDVLIDGLRILAGTKQLRQADLTMHYLVVLRKAQEKMGELLVGELFEKWRIDSFRLPEMEGLH